MRHGPTMVERDDSNDLLRSVGRSSIRLRQATFWELNQIDGPQRYRIRFRKKREFFADETLQGEVSIESSHPLLRDYLESRSSLFLESKVVDAQNVLHSLDGLCSEEFRGWRPLSRYLNSQASPERILAQGYGVLLQGPSDFVRAASKLIARSGIDSQVQPLAESPVETRVLLVGRSFVVADSFEVEVASHVA